MIELWMTLNSLQLCHWLMKIILFQFASYFPYSKMKIKTFIHPAGPTSICKNLKYLESEKLWIKDTRENHIISFYLRIRALLFIHCLIFMLDIFRSWSDYNWEVNNLCRLLMDYWLWVWCPTPWRVAKLEPEPLALWHSWMKSMNEKWTLIWQG